MLEMSVFVYVTIRFTILTRKYVWPKMYFH